MERQRSGLATLAGDVRALGSGAPLRGAYELSRRAGGHALVFGRLARTAGAAPPGRLRPPFRLPDPSQVPASSRARTLDAAAAIAGGRLRVFGRNVDIGVGADPAWHRAPDTGATWPQVPWWKIDLRGSGAAGDPKWVWEPARHRHLVVLARAVALDPAGGTIAPLEDLLTSWLEANPPEIGIHWASNLEIALRAVAWLQVLALAGDRLHPAVRARMEATLWHAGRHLLGDLPYTLSSMRNNHLLGDALGLLAIGRAFGPDRRARRLARVGDAVFDRQLLREVRDDGTTIEDSLSYHRFVLELVALRALLDPSPAAAHRRFLTAGARSLARAGALEGPVPQHGDWDEGRALVATHPADDLRGSVLAALALAGDGAGATARDELDEPAWYAPPGRPAPAVAAERGGHDTGGGHARIVTGDFTVWLKAGTAPWHGHADLTAVAVRLGDEWIVGDPGTGTYNADPELRTHLRSSESHAVTRVDGLDQLVAHRSFRWRHRARCGLGPPIAVGDATIAWGWHDAYRRLDPPRRILRVVIASSRAIAVADWIEGPPGVAYALTLPLAPRCAWHPGASGAGDGTEHRSGEIALASGHRVTVALPRAATYDATCDPAGWSATYGSVEPSTRIEITGRATGPVLWSIAASGAAPPRWLVDNDTVTGPDLSVRADLGASVGSLRITDHTNARTRTLVRRWDHELSNRIG